MTLGWGLEREHPQGISEASLFVVSPCVFVHLLFYLAIHWSVLSFYFPVLTKLFSVTGRMHGPQSNSVAADTPVKAFAAALLQQRKKDGWYHNAIRALRGGGSVVAGIVLQLPSTSGCDEEGKFVCVSLGSGTRCVGYEISAFPVESDLLLRDGHAEVMARRGFVAFLLDAANYLSETESRQHPFVQRCRYAPQRLGETTRETGGFWHCFRLRDGVTVHLVSTEYPCGAMSIPRGGGHVILSAPGGQSLLFSTATVQVMQKEEQRVSYENTTATPTTSTSTNTITEDIADCGRVVVCHGHILAAHRDHPADYLPFVSRVKPGKGRPNLCMSCSDKLLRWHCLGLQGRRRTRLYPERIHFTSVWLPDGTHTDGSADNATRCNVSLRLENASRALNSRRHYFFPAASTGFGSDTLRDARHEVHNMLAPPSPVVVRGFVQSFLYLLLVGGQEETEDVIEVRSDCCWSRSAWVKMTMGDLGYSRYSAGVKRWRKEDDICEGLSDFLTWTESGVAVLNTKDGLPRGVTRQCMSRAVKQLLKIEHSLSKDQKCPDNTTVAMLQLVAERYPLSRLWMMRQHCAIMRSMRLGREGLLVKDSESAAGTDVDVGTDTTNLFLEPLLLVPGEAEDGLRDVVAGGSVHYWLQQGRRCMEGTSGVFRDEEEVQCLPLLWVQKKRTSV